MSVEMTEAIARKVVEVVDAGLVQGVGQPIPGQMCVEAAVCYAMGLPHGDDPTCVSPALRQLKISLNDQAWSSNEARAKGLRRLAVAQLGSAGVLDDREFTRRVVDMTIRKVVPACLRSAAQQVYPTFAEQFEAAAVRCETEGSPQSCRDARDLAASVATAADSVACAYDAADSASCAASVDAACWAAAAADSDGALAQFGEWVVEILIDMQAPGCQWLTLTPKEAA
ncbi:MAG: hypothetical protein EBS05_23750 [Proteobacteria bacterium]|nr:hypothetical protein [Pseudomonadota bacterium]